MDARNADSIAPDKPESDRSRSVSSQGTLIHNFECQIRYPCLSLYTMKITVNSILISDKWQKT